MTASELMLNSGVNCGPCLSNKSERASDEPFGAPEGQCENRGNWGTVIIRVGSPPPVLLVVCLSREGVVAVLLDDPVMS